MPGQQEALTNMRHLQELASQRRNSRPATPEEIEALDDAQGGKCNHCGGYHVRACPRIKRIEWHSNGHIAVVEFWADNEVNWSGVIFEDEAEDNGPYLLLQDVEDDIQLLVDAVRRIGSGSGGVDRDKVIQAMRRIELVIEEARAQTVQSDGAEPA